MSNTTTINSETANIPRINWQVQHHQVPVNLLSQPLILPSLFLTTISMTLDWIKNTSGYPANPSNTSVSKPLQLSLLPPFHSMSNPSFVWGIKDPAFLLKLMEDGYTLKLCIGRRIHSLSPWAKLGRSLCVRWADCSGPTPIEQHLSQLPRWPALHYLSCSYINLFITWSKKITLLAWRDAYLGGKKEILLSCCGRDAQFSLE